MTEQAALWSLVPFALGVVIGEFYLAWFMRKQQHVFTAGLLVATGLASLAATVGLIIFGL